LQAFQENFIMCFLLTLVCLCFVNIQILAKVPSFMLFKILNHYHQSITKKEKSTKHPLAILVSAKNPNTHNNQNDFVIIVISPPLQGRIDHHHHHHHANLITSW